MKKFKFKLKALLSYREHIEKVAKEEVARVQNEINKSIVRTREYEAAIQTTSEEIEMKMEEGMSAGDHLIYSDYVKSLKIKLSEEAYLMEQLTVLLRNKQEELAKKSVSRKVIENLREKQKKDYYSEIDKLTYKEADEMVLISRFYNDGIDTVPHDE